MARRLKARCLNLWANGVTVGQWHVAGHGPDTLQYDADWIASPQGLPVAACEITQFEEQKVLVVERFDRRLSDRGYWLRLPQEDFCQVTGTPPSAKYEADGGPGIVDIASVLQQSEARELDLATLLKAQLLFWAMAATDGHAKNFSVFLLPGGRYQMTPLYDVLSAWPVTGRGPRQLDTNRLKLAMAVKGKNTHYRIKDIQRRHFNHMARLCGWGADMETLIESVIDPLPGVLKAVQAKLPDDSSPGTYSVPLPKA